MPAASRALSAGAVLALAGCAAPGVPALEAALAARPSATAVLQARCAQPIRAIVVRSAAAPAPPGPIEQADGFRQVQLACGEAVLSDARNWYRRDLLTDEMNHALDTSDRPFGAVVAPLGFTRERIASQRGRAGPCPAGTVLSQRGLLRVPDGRPLALVIECYSRAALISAPAD